MTNQMTSSPGLTEVRDFLFSVIKDGSARLDSDILSQSRVKGSMNGAKFGLSIIDNENLTHEEKTRYLKSRITIVGREILETEYKYDTCQSTSLAHKIASCQEELYILQFIVDSMEK